MKTLGIITLAVALLAATASAGSLAVHLDAAQISSTPADGAEVSKWDDLAPYWGNNHAVQVYFNTAPYNGSFNPTYVAASSSNGLPGVSFQSVGDPNGYSQGLCMDSFLNYPQGGGATTDNWVAFSGGGTGIAVLYTNNGNGNAWDFGSFGERSHYGYSNGRIYDDFGETARPETANGWTGAWSDPTIYIVNVQADGTKKTYLNGELQSTLAVTVGWNVNPTIGSRNTDQGYSPGYGGLSNSLGGVINEVKIFEGDMTLAELQAVNNDLAGKFGITIDESAELYVPEPATLALLGIGGLAAVIRRRRR